MKTKKTTSSLTTKPRRMWQDSCGRTCYNKAIAAFGEIEPPTPCLAIPLTDECLGKLREKAQKAYSDGYLDHDAVGDIFRAIGLVAPKQRKRRAGK